MSAGLTLAELADLLDPPVTSRQLFHLVRAINLKPCGYRRTGQPGRPAPTYDAREVMQAHGALGRYWLEALESAASADELDEVPSAV